MLSRIALWDFFGDPVSYATSKQEPMMQFVVSISSIQLYLTYSNYVKRSDKFIITRKWLFSAGHSEQNHTHRRSYSASFIACEQALRLEWRAKRAARERISERQNISVPACDFSK